MQLVLGSIHTQQYEAPMGLFRQVLTCIGHLAIVHEALEDLALCAQPLSIFVQVCFSCNLLAFQALPLLLNNLHPVHLTLPRLIQSLKPAAKAEPVMHRCTYHTMCKLEQLMVTGKRAA